MDAARIILNRYVSGLSLDHKLGLVKYWKEFCKSITIQKASSLTLTSTDSSCSTAFPCEASSTGNDPID